MGRQERRQFAAFKKMLHALKDLRDTLLRRQQTAVFRQDLVDQIRAVRALLQRELVYLAHHTVHQHQTVQTFIHLRSAFFL